MALPGNKNFSDYDNYITDQNPTTSAQAQDYFRNQAELLRAVIDCDFWQPETVYQPGDVVKSDSMPNGTEAVMVATKASVTSNVEPQWGAVGGANISDGACFWKLRWQRPLVMQGSNINSDGEEGLVPAPPATNDELFLNNQGEWKEAGKVKSVNGNIGDVVVDLPVGHMYWSVEPNVPVGRIPAMGATYNRSLYADLWAYANERGLVISESEWQAQASANNGNCAYYSSGDGSTTFRVPSIKCWVKGANSVDEVGSYLEDGLPNIEGQYTITNEASSTYSSSDNGSSAITTGVFTTKPSKATGNYMVTYTGGGGRPLEDIAIDASKSNPIYGNSDTVQPPSIVGQWLIVAFGVAHNVGEADVANVMQAVEQVQTGLGAVDGISDYVVESYRNGTEWYEKYVSGKIIQGGRYGSVSSGSTVTITFHIPFKNPPLFVIRSVQGGGKMAGNIEVDASAGYLQKTATYFTHLQYSADYVAGGEWYAVGY